MALYPDDPDLDSLCGLDRRPAAGGARHHHGRGFFSWFYPGARAGIRQHAGLRGAAYSPRESGEPL